MSRRRLIPLDDRGPLRVMFVITSMPVGGAETLLVNLVRRLDREHFVPLVCCLKEPGPLGEMLTSEIPVFHGLIGGKYDVGVLRRLEQLMRRERVDAVVTVGAGDKMFWGRLAARWAGVPVILSALHSTGWPDVIGRLNRSWLLTRWTDGFIGVAAAHGSYLTEQEHFPGRKVFVIPNGVDVQRFAPRADTAATRRALGIDPQAPLAGIVAALRPEKNHELFLHAAAKVRERIPQAQFLIIGDGPERQRLERLARVLNLSEAAHFVGNREDVPELLAALDVFVLTSRMEANPVSILEAMASGKPVIAPDVGSIGESVVDGHTGYLTPVGQLDPIVERLGQLFRDQQLARRLGNEGREMVVANGSLESMVGGYELLIAQIYQSKCERRQGGRLRPRPGDATKAAANS